MLNRVGILAYDLLIYMDQAFRRLGAIWAWVVWHSATGRGREKNGQLSISSHGVFFFDVWIIRHVLVFFNWEKPRERNAYLKKKPRETSHLRAFVPKFSGGVFARKVFDERPEPNSTDQNAT